MLNQTKRILIGLTALLMTLSNANLAFANETERARKKINEAQSVYSEMLSAYNKIKIYAIKDEYCEGTDDDVKEADMKALSVLHSSAEVAYKKSRNNKNWLNNFIRKGNGKVRKLNSISSGAGTAIKDGSFFKRYDNLLVQITEEYKTALDEIELASRRCSKPKNSDASAPVSDPASAPAATVSENVSYLVDSLLAGVQLNVDYAEISFPDIPKIFCTIEEKNALSREFFRLENLAIANHRTARRLRLRIFEKQDKYKRLREANIIAADAAAARGDLKEVAERADLLRAYNIVLDMLPTEFEKAVSEVERRAKVLDKVRSEKTKLDDIPTIDCTNVDDQAANSTDMLDRLHAARSNAPDYNGGLNGASASQYGVPNFDKIQRDRILNGGSGFDGSEATNAAQQAAYDVDLTPRTLIVEKPTPFTGSTARIVPARTTPVMAETTPSPKIESPAEQPTAPRQAPSFRPVDIQVERPTPVTVDTPAPQTAPKPVAVPADSAPVFNGTFAPQPTPSGVDEEGQMTAVEAPPLVILDYLGNPVEGQTNQNPFYDRGAQPTEQQETGN